MFPSNLSLGTRLSSIIQSDPMSENEGTDVTTAQESLGKKEMKEIINSWTRKHLIVELAEDLVEEKADLIAVSAEIQPTPLQSPIITPVPNKKTPSKSSSKKSKRTPRIASSSSQLALLVKSISEVNQAASVESEPTSSDLMVDGILSTSVVKDLSVLVKKSLLNEGYVQFMNEFNADCALEYGKTHQSEILYSYTSCISS